MSDAVVAYYRQFLNERSWCVEGLSWTVIQPASVPVTEDIVLRRLRGQRVDLTEIHFPHVNDFRPGMPDESKVAYLTQVGPAVVMFQPSGFEGARREVLRWLSDGARVHNIDWTINGNGGISYAVYGNVLAWVDKNDPGRRHGEQPDVLDNDLDGLREARRRWDAGDLADAEFNAEAMALVERRTGVRLDAGWVDAGWVDGLEEPGQAVMIGDIPRDPTPPGRLGYKDPDLDSRLRSAPELTRRAALTLVARALADRFTFSDPAAVASTVDSVERGALLAPEMPRPHPATRLRLLPRPTPPDVAVDVVARRLRFDSPDQPAMGPMKAGIPARRVTGPSLPPPHIQWDYRIPRVSDMAEIQLSDVFVEASDTLVDDFDVIEFLHVLADRCVQLLGVSAAGLLVTDQQDNLQVVAASSERSRLLELFQLQTDQGPCVDCFRTGQPVSVIDLRTAGHRWPRFTAAAAEVGFAAVHALPMRLRSEVIGALNLFDIHPGALAEGKVRIGQALADVATIGLLQQRAIHHRDILTEQLQAALNSRVLIEQAKGVLAERLQVDVGEAFALLRNGARSRNRRLSDLAQAIIDGSEQLAPGTAANLSA